MQSRSSRRGFLKLGAAAAAATLAAKAAAQTTPATPATTPATATATATAPARGGRGGAAAAPPLPALGNGENLAMTFQAYPGGTGALLEKMVQERGAAAFARSEFKVEPWAGQVPASDEEIAFLPVHRLAGLIQSQKLSPVRLAQIYIDRLKKLDPKLLCAVTIMEEQGLAAANEAEAEIKAGKYRGPLHGIPWGVKDLFAARGTPTTWGADEYKDRVTDFDAEVVARLRAAGAVLIAKLATGRFALGDQWYRGRTNNPWNLNAGSSGSSAGPASATAAGCVAFGIGTETRGSIVSPASVCGLAALRPTYGRVSRTGGMVLAWTQDRVGPICRTVEDCALVFSAIHGADESDPTTLTMPFAFERNIDLSKIRIGYDRSAPQAFIDKLKELGANPVAMPARPRVIPGLNSLDPEEAAAFDGELASGKLQDVDTNYGKAAPGARGGRFTAARPITAIDYIKVQRHRLILMQQMARLMQDFDLYVVQNDAGESTLTALTGNPCVVVPWNFASSGRGNVPPQPQCTFLVGALFADDKLLSVAHAYQKATDWHEKHPVLTA
ncbi:MAG TPA: amidase [Phycisphaerae bacterium]|nr:amidase [Phycisphaerae bacterium]